MPSIAVINKSTLLKDADVQTMCSAIQIQMNTMVAPAWRVDPATIQFYADPSTVPSNWWLFTMIDNDNSVPGALGYHTLNDQGQVIAFIMAQPILTPSAGGVVLFDPKNPNNYSVSGCLSHECLEALLDKYCDLYAVDNTTMYAFEICDPCEDTNIVVQVSGQSVFVSDFVCPEYFNAENTTGPFDYCRKLTAPFSLTSGGYCVSGTSPSNLTQVFGEEMPDWRRAMKKSPFSRASRRLGAPKPSLLKRFIAWVDSL
jgi:hypothetical protein